MPTPATTDHRFHSVFGELALSAMRLAGIGLIAIGVSGVLAFGLALVAGKAFVAGAPPGVHYSAQRCDEFYEDAPHARTCEEAAAKHRFGEVVWYRVAAGALGALVFAAATGLRRRRGPGELVPETLMPTIAATTFGLAGIWLVIHSIDLIVINADSGGGGYLSGGAVALALAAWFAVPVVKALAIRRPVSAAA